MVFGSYRVPNEIKENVEGEIKCLQGNSDAYVENHNEDLAESPDENPSNMGLIKPVDLQSMNSLTDLMSLAHSTKTYQKQDTITRNIVESKILYDNSNKKSQSEYTPGETPLENNSEVIVESSLEENDNDNGIESIIKRLEKKQNRMEKKIDRGQKEFKNEVSTMKGGQVEVKKDQKEITGHVEPKYDIKTLGGIVIYAIAATLILVSGEEIVRRMLVLY